MYLTRKAEFSASHICRNPDWTDQQNRETYGENANPNGHGHNYVLEVTLTGQPDPVTGMVFDLRELKDILNREVVNPMDHRFLNHEVPPFDTIVPTTENIAAEIWRRIEPQLATDRARLYNVRLYETPDLYVDFTGPAAANGDRP